MRLTVVVCCVIRADNRHRRVNRIDGLITVRHVEGDLGEVGIGISELSVSQAHVRGAGICPGRSRRAAEGEVCFRIQRIADFYVIAADAVLCSVIGRGVVMACDGHDHFVDRRDRLITIRHVEGHIREVVVVIGELIRCQTHGRGAFIRPGCCRRAAEGEISFLIQRVADFHIISADAVLLAVIGRSVMMSRDGYGHVNRIDRLITIRHVEGHGTKVGIGIGKLAGRQVHIRGTGSSPGHGRGTGEGEVFRHIVQVRVRCGGIARHGMSGTIVIGRVVVADDRHGYVDGRNSLITIRHIEGDVEVVIGIGKLGCCQAHVRGAGIRPLRDLCSAEGEVMFDIIQLGICRRRIAGHGMLSAVVRGGVVRADDGYGHIDRIDLLITVNNGEYRVNVPIVAGELTGCQVHVRGSGNRPLRAGRSAEADIRRGKQRIIGRYFVSGHSMRAAVIITGVIMTGNRDIRGDLVDLQFTVVDREAYIIIVVCIAESALIQAHGIRSRVGPAHRGCSAVLDFTRVKSGDIACGGIARNCLLRPIVRHFRLVTGNGNRQISLRDSECSVRIGNDIVSGHILRTGRNGVNTNIFPGRAGCAGMNRIAVDRSGHCRGQLRIRSAVSL